MDFDKVQPGLTGEKTETVNDGNTARKYGSGSIDVYATPAMIGLLEGACLAAVDTVLPAGWSTVGTELKVKHSAATPVGMKVRALGELIEVDGRRLVFKVEAFDEAGSIGAGTHERFIIDVEKFRAKAAAKKGS